MHGKKKIKNSSTEKEKEYSRVNEEHSLRISLKKIVPSWGDVVDYFREESSVMNKWMKEIEDAILPQSKAVLHLPFRQCDNQRKGINL